MSKILVIEPYNILRHGFAVALADAHQVDVLTTIPEAETLSSADLVIVDGAGLRERNALTEEGIRAIQNRKLPTIWIDSDKESSVPGGNGLRRFKWPVEKDTLRKAVADCLRRIDSSPQPDSRSVKTVRAPGSSKRKATEGSALRSAAGGEKKIIELVDVVE